MSNVPAFQIKDLLLHQLFIIVNGISLGFELLTRHNNTLEVVILDIGEL